MLTRFKKTEEAYKAFIYNSEKDVKDTELEVERLKHELDKEHAYSDVLQKEVDINQHEFDLVDDEFKQLKI